MKTIALICLLLLLVSLFGMAYALDLKEYAVPQNGLLYKLHRLSSK